MLTPIHFPASLPVCGRQADIVAALNQHQVVIVCGETGSGKTTQLPKMALAMGRGCQKKIGHTQPRRIAASTVAKRIAEELNTELGDLVGFKVRFQEKMCSNTAIKLMTDGILLAETQNDPLLNAYDTIIIDEAHERSLNIDFLLGYLRQILPHRPDLKIIVTSATIDSERFARHFASSKGDAPVILVSGRLFPVEVRYQPLQSFSLANGVDGNVHTLLSQTQILQQKNTPANNTQNQRDYSINHAIADAIDELWRDAQQGGDVLVFLAGEREIRDATEHLRGHFSHSVWLRGTQVLPLFARLSQIEQDRIFQPHSGHHSRERRVVLATNVAETSLTVPGIRYVVDVGTARVKRYSFRNKVEQLLVEPISQSSANQRMGRCGRVANGICIRLYDEMSFAARPAFTEPEILRSSLAGVILRMKALHLGTVEHFPFLEAPHGRAIADGYQLLDELGAIDLLNEEKELTPLGKELALLPLDPRIARMFVEAKNRGALDEVLVIASALSVQDVRDRPIELQQVADAAHAKFDDDRSEFVGHLKLWDWLNQLKGNNDPITPLKQKMTNRQQEQALRQHFINPRKVREWRDTHKQLLQVVQEQKWRINAQPASYDALHLSLLSGLLGNVGYKADVGVATGLPRITDGKDANGRSKGSNSNPNEYLGARGIKFLPHPGVHLRKRPGRWVMASELVETTKLYGRGIANIEPQWLETVAPHLLKKQLLDPHWEKKAAEVVALERATLYGLVVYNGRRVNFGKVDAASARDVFIRSALVNGDWDVTQSTSSVQKLMQHNQKMITQVQAFEHKSRRQDVMVDEELLYAFYDKTIPSGVYSGASFATWYKLAIQTEPNVLRLDKHDLMQHEAAGITAQNFPKFIRLGGIDCLVHYLHDMGDARDGMTVQIPLFVLNQINEDRCSWLVKGMLKDKIAALLKSLPQKSRSRLVPIPNSAQRLADELMDDVHFGNGDLFDVLLKHVKTATQIEVQKNDFKMETLSPHFFMNFCVCDEHGRQLAMGRNLGAIKTQWGHNARGAFQALAGLKLNSVFNTSDATLHGATTVNPSGVNLSTNNKSNNGFINLTATTAAPMPPQKRHTQWDFGELPEFMEINKGGQSLVGFPALVDCGDAVIIEVFDEPHLASQKHKAGLCRLFALQLKDALKYVDKNLPNLTTMGTTYMAMGGTLDELKKQIMQVSIEKAFLTAPLPTSAADFTKRLEEGRNRLNLTAQEVARLVAVVLQDYAMTTKRVKEYQNKPSTAAASADVMQQLARLMPKNFITHTPFLQLQHFPRYLKAVVLRLDKCATDAARDTNKIKEMQVIEQNHWRLLNERKGVADVRLMDFRWLLEELRVRFFAQELRTPQPVSVKRLEKLWLQIQT